MEFLQLAALVAATITMGLMAGLLFTFANSIMPGLAGTDDRTFVGAFQAIDKAITNPLFLLGYVGAFVFTLLAVGLHLGADQRPVLVWTVAALGLYLVTLLITGVVNLPLNRALQAAGPPDEVEDLAGAREEFEGQWVWWNTVRTVTTIAAFACLIVALVVVPS